MTRLRVFAQRVLGLFRKGRLDSALDEELRDAPRDGGRGAPSGRVSRPTRRATRRRRRFGGVEQTQGDLSRSARPARRGGVAQGPEAGAEDARAQPGIHRVRRALAGARHRRQYRGVQRLPSRGAPAVRLPGSRQAGGRLGDAQLAGGFDLGIGLLPQSGRLAAGELGLRDDRRLQPRRRPPVARERDPARAGRARRGCGLRRGEGRDRHSDGRSCRRTPRQGGIGWWSSVTACGRGSSRPNRPSSAGPWRSTAPPTPSSA